MAAECIYNGFSWVGFTWCSHKAENQHKQKTDRVISAEHLQLVTGGWASLMLLVSQKTFDVVFSVCIDLWTSKHFPMRIFLESFRSFINRSYSLVISVRDHPVIKVGTLETVNEIFKWMSLFFIRFSLSGSHYFSNDKVVSCWLEEWRCWFSE